MQDPDCGWEDIFVQYATIPDEEQMTNADQRRMIRELKDSAFRMNRSDEEAFAMMVKRDKDDEDLDLLAMKRLREMHEKYVHGGGRRS
jgi:hypothetical protein